MSALGSPSPLFLASAAADAAAAGPSKSVRFNDDDSAHLTRTPSSAGNRKTWTWAGWIKRCGNTTLETIFSAGGSNTAFRTNITVFLYQDDTSTHGGRLVVGEGNGAYLRTNAVFRDTGAWGHLVIVADTTLATATDRIKIYWNGVRITDFASNNLSAWVAQNSDLGYNTTDRHAIGAQSYNNSLSLYSNSYMADVYFIDGQAKQPTDFGEFDSNGVFQATAYDGTFGSNGYHLFDFANESGIGNDSSGNNNDFTPANLAASTTNAFNLNVTSTPFTDTGTGVTITNYGGVTTAAAGTNSFNLGTVATFGGSGSGDFLKGDTVTFGDAYTIDYYFNGNLSQVSNATVIDIGGEASIRDYGGQTSRTIRLKNSSNQRTDYSYTASSGWNHVRVTNTGIWVNGTSINSSPRSMSGTSGTLYIGTYNNSTSYLFNGKIGPMRINTGSNQGAPASGGLVASSDGTLPEVSAANTDGDVLFDAPTNGSQSDTGAGGEVSGNYCTINSLIVNQTNAITSNGNLHVKYPNTEDSWVGNIQGTNYVTFVGTMGLTSGKWYFEAVETVRETSTESMVVGVVDTPMGGGYHIGSVGNGIGYKRIEVKNGLGSSIVTTSSMPDFSVGDVVGVALDLDNGKIYFSVNGTYINSGNPAAGTGFLASGLSGTFFPAISRWSRRHSIEADLNFGQRAFNTSAPSGFKAICTANLPTPTVADGSTAFDAVLYTSTSGSGRTRTISGLNFSPDMVWSKRRSAAGRHVISDSVRGTNKELFPNRTDIERTSTDGLTAFTSDGYSSGPDSGAFGWSSDNATYVNWAWDAGTSNASNSSGSITSTVRANTTAGFSIVSYTGTGSAATVGHGLGAAPEWIVVKNRDTSKNWIVYHAHIHSSPAEKSINLNESGELYDSAVTFNDTAPTSTVFSVGTGQSTNKSGDDHIAYCFAPVAGFSAFGSYTGNQSTDGTYVHTGFKVAFLMLKHTQTSGYDWAMNDSTRNTFNPASNALFPSSSDDEDSTRHVDLLSNGFKLRNSSPIYNQSGVVYIYMAFAENPFQANGGLAR